MVQREVIADRFELERLVGSGGMGEVYRARDRLTGGAVAVKVLHAAGARDAERFRREAQILADVSHPRIVKYVAHGIASTKRPYLAMEWLDGEDLADGLLRRGLTLHESLTLARGIAEGLAVLHEHGIVHRDIKPSNIFLVANKPSSIKLLDLGVARLLYSSRASTRSGVMIGTPGYMAPEQARGVKEIDPRADIFSLGCVLFECITGRPVFQGENIAALLAKILLEKPPTLAEVGAIVPPALDGLVTRMLSKHAGDRPATGAALLRELDAFASIEDSPPQRASVPKQRALTGSERRLVSVVMAAFDPPDEDALPESAHMTAVASFDPNAIVASFGAEAEHLADGSIVVTLTGKGGASDQAAHAARCALALRTHLIDAQVSLATGLATVTGQSCVGDVIERAAQLLETARSRDAVSGEETMHGQTPVFLDETTAGLLDMRFDVGGDSRGLFIRGLRDRETKARTLLGKPTPFVGRDRELGTLRALYDECVSEPVARAVLVTGPPGAGKSRMVSELIRQISEDRGARANDAQLWLARGDPMSEGSPFSLLARVLRRASGISGSEPLVVRQQKLRARVARHVPEQDVQRLTEFLGEIASVHFPDVASVQLRTARQDAILMGDQMRRAFTDLMTAETAAAPIVIVLEDLHWGDLPSVNFIDAALRSAAEAPLMVLAVARSEVLDQFPNLWEERNLQEVRLGPLVRRAGERLVREVLGSSMSPDEVARLLDRAAGNVFYLEELIRAYAEGSDRPSAPGTVPPPTDKNGAWALPGTVLAMVEARLERLDPMARRVLRAASIFGEVFWRGGVLALTGGDYEASEVDEWLSDLATREIVQRRDVSRFPSEHELSFRHGLVRDAAYQMLTAEDRALGHRLAAEWLERSGEHEPMVLAEHFERGGALGQAISFYARGAVQALEGNDFAAARTRAERAIQAGADGDELGRLDLLLAEACRWSGDHASALTYARGAHLRLTRGTDEWCAAVAEGVEAAMTLGHSVDAEMIANDESGTAESMTAAYVIASARIAVRFVAAGKFDHAEAMIARIDSRAPASVIAEPGARAFVLAARVARAKWLGDPEDAVILAREAFECFDRVGDLRNAAAQRDNAGFALVQLGAFADAQPLLEEAIASADRLGLVVVANETRLHLGQLFARMGRRDESVHKIEEVIGGFVIQRDPGGEGRARAYLAGALHLAGEFALAEAEALRALPLVQHVQAYRAPLLGLIALSRADHGDAAASLEAGTAAVGVLDQLGGTIESEALARIGYAEGLRAIGDIEGSKKAIASARDRLLARAARIKNPEWRRGFMERLQEHRRILLRAGEWLV